MPTAEASPLKGDCSSRSFRALFAAQFLGAFNDNFTKIVLSLLVLDVVPDENTSSQILSIILAVFVLPFILFSSYAGYFADRYRKSTIIKVAKWAELGIAFLFCTFFISQNIPVLIGLLFLMGAHSTFFSPAKYGILPEILSDKELSKGNGFIEFGTFLAMILGISLGSGLKGIGGTDLTLPGLVVVAVSIGGVIAAWLVSATEIANPTKKFEVNAFNNIARSLKDIHAFRPLFLALLAISYFWFLASMFHSAILMYAKHLLHVSDTMSGVLLAVLAVGIGTGSIFAGKVSEGKVELGLVPIGAVGVGTFCGLLYFTDHSFVLTALVLLCLGLSSGFYVVPLNSFMQHESPAAERGRFLGTLNFACFSAMLGSAMLFAALSHKSIFAFSPRDIFLLLSVATFAAAVWIVRTLPQVMVRCVNWMFSRCVYSLQVVGIENVPKTGGALLVSNHVSFADPSLILAALERPVRFIMYKPIYDLPVVNRIARIMGAIPVNPAGSPKGLIRALQEAREAVAQGELVCIFAEGAITRIGRMIPFSRGLERIMTGLNAPIIPIHLDELWGSILSFAGGKFFFKMPKELPYPATLFFGKPLPASSTAPEVRQAVQELSANSFLYRRRRHRILSSGLVYQAKSHPFRQCIADSTGRAVRYVELLAASVFLSRQLGLRRQEMVGILIPASVGGVLANVAATFAGAVPVNLNFTLSESSLRSAVEQCQMKRVITSKAFEKKVNFALGIEKIYIEDLLEQFTTQERVKLFAASLLFPTWLFERRYLARNIESNEIATVMFSSGTTGEPKGVILSHGNIASNIESIYDLFQLTKRDCLLGILPLFHSFGFTATMWMPLVGGFKAVYHPNPLETKVIGGLAAKHGATILMATPTFLQNYIKKIPPEDFATLRIVVTGAEKLRDSLAYAFRDKYGVTPLEGYGCTELSPVAMVNSLSFDGRGAHQAGAKLGTVGHPIPGVASRVVNPDTFQVLPPGQEGLLLIHGPNVMQGYLGKPEKTAEVLRDGWYVTGDIAVMDEEGFIAIRDRISRFSKIGGEMVPHIKIEEEIHNVLGILEQSVVVTAVPDEAKGERLVVLHAVELDSEVMVRELQTRGLPNLWIPKRDSFYRIESLPVLGTGKLDLQRSKQLAAGFVAGAGS